MKKFVRYLYAYKNGKPVRNVGFVKCEENEGKAVLQIYGKGFPVNGNDMFELFIFYPEEEKCIGISMGTLKNVSPVFSYRLEYDVNDVEGQETFDKVEGVILTKGQGDEKSWYAAKWNENLLNIEQMIHREEVCAQENAQEEPQEVCAQEDVQEEPEEVCVEEDAQVEPEEACAEEDAQEESEEIFVENESQEEPESEVCTVETDGVKEKDPAEKDLIYKITRQDLAKLPRCEWKLANNQFLLHGYRNYHHLVSFEKEGACWLGVPGVFHPDEQKVARAFGFVQFMRPDEGEIELSEEQREENDEFGYWCRTVSSVIEG